MEAVEYLRTKRRMCETHPLCTGCPMAYSEKKCSVGCLQLEEDFPEEAVERVKKWGKGCHVRYLRRENEN